MVGIFWPQRFLSSAELSWAVPCNQDLPSQHEVFGLWTELVTSVARNLLTYTSNDIACTMLQGPCFSGHSRSLWAVPPCPPKNDTAFKEMLRHHAAPKKCRPQICSGIHKPQWQVGSKRNKNIERITGSTRTSRNAWLCGALRGKWNWVHHP